MLISVVTGTYQRLESLQRMVRSVRVNTAWDVDLEVVVVDGGSTDGTIQWCRAQKDILLIEHGDLRGAIRAFTDGAYAAHGDYIVLSNDDVELMPGSIVGAFSYLESHPKCGAVAFMDDRPSSYKQRPNEFAAQTMPAVLPDGSEVRVLYAQVGMYRPALGDTAGWWGADDPVMGQARTYGGDNFLSAAIWEYGYTVDVVPGVQARDFTIEDELRQNNYNVNDTAFYTRYPKGPHIDSRPFTVPVLPERLRILSLPIYEPGAPIQRTTKRGLREALRRRSVVYEWDYLGRAPAVAEELQGFAPHIILTQFHDGSHADIMRTLRSLCPQAIILNWNGDARSLTEPNYVAMLKLVDMQLVTNAAALPVYAENGIRSAYWQIGYEPRQNVPAKEKSRDAVFMGSCYNEHRRDIEQALGDKVTFFGRGWQHSEGDTIYNFDIGDAIYSHAKVAISDAFSDGTTALHGFVSNRFFEALASGVLLLQEHVEGLDDINGTIAGVHYIEWSSISQLAALIVKWTAPGMDKERKAIADAGKAFVREHYSFDAQVDKLFGDILPWLDK